MTSPSTTVGLSALMLVAGLGIPVMAAINATLGTRIENPTFAAFTLFAVGLTATGIAMFWSGFPRIDTIASTPPMLFVGGLFVAFYVLSVTYSAPIIGLGSAVFLVLLGQLVCAAFIDHYGLLGVVQSSITPRRLLGLGLMTTGLYLARNAT